MSEFRLPMAFHETFSLNRPAIAQVLAVVATGGDSARPRSKSSLISQLRESTGLGNNYLKSMPRYTQGIGLLDEKYWLTGFGQFACVHDPMLDSHGTLWLIHYMMSGHSGPGPEFWHELCSTYFRVGNRFTRQEITANIAALYEKSTGKPASISSLNSTTTIFLGTYTKYDGLGNLGILVKDADHYVVTQPDAPSAWAFGYALIDDWERRHVGRLSINLDDLTQARGLGSLFLLDESAVNAALSELQRAAVVELYRSARPYQLLLLMHDREAMLRKVYGVDDSITTA